MILKILYGSQCYKITPQMTGFRLFAQHLLETCGTSSKLSHYLDVPQLKSPKPTWMNEFLKVKIGKTKLLTLLKKITSSGSDIGLELIDLLKMIEAVNEDEQAFDLDFEELAVYVDAVDKCSVSGKEKMIMVGEVTDALIGIVEAMFRAAAGLICDESALELHEMEKMARAEPEAELMPMFDMIIESILATNSKVEALSDTVQTLATALSALMSNTTTERKTVGMSQPRGSLSMTQIAGLPSQVFPNNVKSSERCETYRLLA
jgi:hypothetical protein